MGNRAFCRSPSGRPRRREPRTTSHRLCDTPRHYILWVLCSAATRQTGLFYQQTAESASRQVEGAASLGMARAAKRAPAGSPDPAVRARIWRSGPSEWTEPVAKMRIVTNGPYKAQDFRGLLQGYGSGFRQIPVVCQDLQTRAKSLGSLASTDKATTVQKVPGQPMQPVCRT